MDIKTMKGNLAEIAKMCMHRPPPNKGKGTLCSEMAKAGNNRVVICAKSNTVIISCVNCPIYSLNEYGNIQLIWLANT